MPIVLWDASALVLRYLPETGSEVVDAIFDAVPISDMALAMIGYSEVFSILWRRHNASILSLKTFKSATSALESDFLMGAPMLLEMSNGSVLKSLRSLQKHNINSTDAVILTLFQEHSITVRRNDVVVVSGDHRMLRAAASEGLAVIEPDDFEVKDIANFLAAL